MRNRSSDYTGRVVVDRDSVEDEVRLAGHSFAKSPVIDTLDPLHRVANQYLCRFTEDGQVFIRVLNENNDLVSVVVLRARE